MRTTLDIDEGLLQGALRATSLPTKTAVIEEGLRSLIRRHAAARLIALGGALPAAEAAPRRRPAGRTRRP